MNSLKKQKARIRYEFGLLLLGEFDSVELQGIETPNYLLINQFIRRVDLLSPPNFLRFNFNQMESIRIRS